MEQTCLCLHSSNQIESALCMFSLFHNKCAYESCSLRGNDRHHLLWYTVKRYWLFFSVSMVSFI